METISFLIFGAIDGIWSLLVYVVFGLIAAGIAKAIMPGKEPGGFFVTALIGIGAAYLGGFARSLLGISHDHEISFFSPLDWVFSILCALLILFIWKKVVGKPSK